jgi:hypothetical protein
MGWMRTGKHTDEAHDEDRCRRRRRRSKYAQLSIDASQEVLTTPQRFARPTCWKASNWIKNSYPAPEPYPVAGALKHAPIGYDDAAFAHAPASRCVRNPLWCLRRVLCSFELM